MDIVKAMELQAAELHDELKKITEEKQWSQKADEILHKPPPAIELKEVFHATWTTAGHHIRSQIGADARLVSLLRHVLPPYDGPDILLYRGENLARWQSGNIGFCWSKSIETARMFARGLNSIYSGGVLISSFCSRVAVIAGPGMHSDYLGEDEFTVDPRNLSDVQVLEQFPP